MCPDDDDRVVAPRGVHRRRAARLVEPLAGRPPARGGDQAAGDRPPHRHRADAARRLRAGARLVLHRPRAVARRRCHAARRPPVHRRPRRRSCWPTSRYIGGFLALDTWRWWTFALSAVPAGLVVATVGVRIVRATAVEPRPVQLGVRAYLVVILMMFAVACGAGSWLVVAGAALFVTSDSVLGWRSFVAATPGHREQRGGHGHLPRRPTHAHPVAAVVRRPLRSASSSDHATSRSMRGSGGRPSTRSPMMLRCTSSEPAAMR